MQKQRKDRLKGAKLPGYIADKDIIDAVFDDMERTGIKTPKAQICMMIHLFFGKGLSFHIKRHRKIKLHKIGQFKQTRKGSRLALNKAQARYRRRILHNRARSQSQETKRKLLKKNKLINEKLSN
jgi:nucleoid DNA-binding protein